MSLRKFEILELIAKGGMAEVYRARTVGLEGFAKEVCVKKVLPHLTEDQTFISMFVDEAKLAATLNYANIVSVHDLCVSAERDYFIVMEYVHGKDLSDIIRAAQLAGREVPADIAVFVCREIAKGLYYAHTKKDADGASLNIIHRDISPQNILVSHMGEVKITDFGIAKASSIMNKTQAGILKGKYGYMSPEQARGEPLDARSDLFNLGIVLYELLVGERCFAGASDYSTLNLMREATVTPPSKINKNVSPALEAIVLKALSRHAKDRYADALEMEAALAGFARSTVEARSVDLARFMRELFSNEAPRQAGQGSSTGVLALSSVVGPAPEAPRKADKPEAEKKEAPPPKKPRKEPAAAAPAGAPPGEAAKPAEPPPEKPPEKPAKAAAKEPAPAAKEVEAPKEAEPRKEAEPKKERKPARIKPGPEAEEAAPKSTSPKVPVGRKQLKPGLTAISHLSRSGRRWRWLQAAGVVAVAGVVGAGLGWARTQGSNADRAFRERELAGAPAADPDKPKTVTVVIDTTPPGATVWLDKEKLAERTPVSVPRPADAKDHDLELSLDGWRPVKRSFKLEDGPVTLVREELAGEQGRLRVRSTPEGLPVKIDGKDSGRTPLALDVSAGPHTIEIGGDADMEAVRVEETVRAREETLVDRKVPKRGDRATLDLRSDPVASVTIDGAAGHTTNGGPIDLDPEVIHKIVVADETRSVRRELSVELRKGERKQIFLDLSEP